MNGNDRERLFDALGRAFPRSDLLLISKGGEVSLCRPALHVLGPSVRVPPEPITSFSSGGIDCHLLALSLPENFHMLIGLPAEDYPSPVSALMMALSLKQAVCSHRRPGPEGGRDKRALFIKQLLQGPATEDVSLISMLARELDIDLSVPRAVCALRLGRWEEDPLKRRERAVQAAELILSLRAADPQDIVGIDETSQILLCRRLGREAASVKIQCGAYFTQLLGKLSAGPAPGAQIGVGFTVTSVPEYAHSYAAARLVLQHCRAQPDSVRYAIDYILELIFENSPPELLEHFLEEESQRLAENPMLLRTVEALLDCSMNMTDAAGRLYIHRNTLVFRMRQIRSLMGLDPIWRDGDRYTLRLLYSYYRWRQQPNPET